MRASLPSFGQWEPTQDNIKDWLYADVDKPTTLDLIRMLNNEKIIKLRKRKALLEIQNKFYWFPVVKKKKFWIQE